MATARKSDCDLPALKMRASKTFGATPFRSFDAMQSANVTHKG